MGDRVASALSRWLPADAEGRAVVLGLADAIERLGLDPAAEILALHRRFRPPSARPRSGPRDPPPDGEIALEPLPPAAGPALWPHRPQHLSGELFSGWLWRAASGAGVPPRRLAAEALRTRAVEAVDERTPAKPIRRLAGLTGQPARHLLGGLLVADAGVDEAPEALALDMALRHGGCLLHRPPPPDARRAKPAAALPVLQYCPACFAGGGADAWFRRRWRFPFDAFCAEHGLRLHDGCWSCGAPVAPLAGSSTGAAPACHRCGALLRDAPRERVPVGHVRRQEKLWDMLGFVAAAAPPAAQAAHLRALAAIGLAASGAAVEERARTIARLPEQSARWFGPPADGRNARALLLIVRGRNLATVLHDDRPSEPVEIRGARGGRKPGRRPGRPPRTR